MVRGYDVVISEAAQSQVDHLRTMHVVRYKLAVDSLLEDPTLLNPHVVLVDFGHVAASGELAAETYALTRGDVVVTFTFMNALVVVVLYVDVMPPPPRPRAGPDNEWGGFDPVL